MSQPLPRNLNVRTTLDIFLVSAVSSLLAVRLFLHLSGYPQLGGDSLHIAHMLYGGILMLVALVVSFSFIGRRAQRLSALIGGVGFGVFIDELGKFITNDNDYFFEPTVGIIYAIFVVLYLTFNFLVRQQTVSSREYQLNALLQLEEAAALDMDRTEKRKVAHLLAKADQSSQFTQQLQALLETIPTVAVARPGPVMRFRAAVAKQYRRFWQLRNSNRLIRIFFVGQALLFIAGVFLGAYTSIDTLLDLFQSSQHHDTWLAVGQLLGSLAAAGYALYGASQLAVSRANAFEQFRRAVLINLLFTEFFIFTRIEFAALPSFAFNLLLLLLISFVITQEAHQSAKTAPAK